jgi:hypothetical protein
VDVDRRYPASVIVVHSAIAAIWESVHEEYRRAGVEWGGLLWGQVYRGSDGRMVPVVMLATKGRCQATRASCEILPESWTIGRRELPAGSDWVNLGDYHSHPNFGVFMSADDCASFWAWGHLPHWVGMVIDPLRGQAGCYVKRSQAEFRRLPGLWVPDEKLHDELRNLDAVPSGEPGGGLS